MICPHCAQATPNESHFCVSCGRPVGAPATAPPVATTETVVAALRPSFLFVGVRYALACVFTVAAVVVGAFIEAKIWSPIAPVVPWAVAFACAAAFVGPLYRHVRRETSTYTLTTQKIEIAVGVLSRVTRHIPLWNVQDVTVARSPMKRMLGIGDVVIDSAAAAGKITLHNVRNPLQVSDEILRLAARK